MKKIVKPILVAAVTVISAAQVYADGPKKLDVASTFGTNNFLGQVAVELGNNISVATGGDVSLKVHEPGDLVPALEVFTSVSTGALPAGWDWVGYWSDIVPVTKLYGSLPFGPTPEVFSGWMWEGGGLEILQSAYDPYNVKVLPCLMNAQETAGWFNKEIQSSADYKGLKMRISGLGAKVIEQLGASPQLIPGAEIYTALERGRIDATEFANPLVDINMGFDEIAKYYYFPGWHQSASWMSLIINKDIWNEYDELAQKQITLACKATLQRSMAVVTAENMKALNKLKDKGVDVRRLPEPVIQDLKNAWGEVRQQEIKDNPLFAKAYKSLMSYQALVKEWDELQEMPRDSED
ncbi:TRAP transporter substrate-binding protein [Marinobacter sp.]|uniref:TRAP transporter substrate-binding protein n=1 Tax=Marinobacter sp. TaxID=50741 RepID=UPI003A8DB50D